MNLTRQTQARPGYLLGVLFFTGLVTANATFAQIESPQISSQGIRDFAAYWSAARLLLTGNNPFPRLSRYSVRSECRKRRR